jgi:hypothetical protein
MSVDRILSLHENARPHKVDTTADFMGRYGWEKLLCLPYRYDMSLPDHDVSKFEETIVRKTVLKHQGDDHRRDQSYLMYQQ